MRGLDLEPTDILLRLLSRELEELSNRLVTISSEAAPELGDDIAAVVSDLDRCEAAVEVLQSRTNPKQKR
jgi:hypothetical protein